MPSLLIRPFSRAVFCGTDRVDDLLPFFCYFSAAGMPILLFCCKAMVICQLCCDRNTHDRQNPGDEVPTRGSIFFILRINQPNQRQKAKFRLGSFGGYGVTWCHCFLPTRLFNHSIYSLDSTGIYSVCPGDGVCDELDNLETGQFAKVEALHTRQHCNTRSSCDVKPETRLGQSDPKNFLLLLFSTHHHNIDSNDH